MTFRLWSRVEVALLREHYPRSGPKATLHALHEAGFDDRKYQQVQAKARRLGVKYHRPPKATSVEERRPVVPRSRRPLYDLAETPGLTPAQYDRRKAEILKEDSTS